MASLSSGILERHLLHLSALSRPSMADFCSSDCLEITFIYKLNLGLGNSNCCLAKGHQLHDFPYKQPFGLAIVLHPSYKTKLKSEVCFPPTSLHSFINQDLSLAPFLLGCGNHRRGDWLQFCSDLGALSKGLYLPPWFPGILYQQPLGMKPSWSN